MHYRLTAVLIAGLVAFAGSESQAALQATAPRTVTQAVPAVSFDDLPPTGPPTAGPTVQQLGVTVTTRPLPRPATAKAHPVTRADLDRAGVLVAAYRSAAAAAPTSCHLPVALLAAIGQIESGSAGGRQIGSDHVVRPGIFGPLLDGGPFAVIRDTDHGRFDGSSQWDRAVGPMQFIPSTWAWAGVDGDGDGKADPQNVYDAARSAAGYLCRYNRDLSKAPDLRAAIWAYNQSQDYVSAVLEWLDYFNGKGLAAVGSVGFRVASGGRASELPPVAPTSTAAKAAQAAKARSTAASKPTATTRGSTPEPVTTTPSSTTGSGTTSPGTATGSTPTTDGTDGTEPTPTDTPSCPTEEPTPTTSTTTATPTPTPTTTTTTEPTPTTSCDPTPTPSDTSSTTATPSDTSTTAAESTATAPGGTTGSTTSSP